MPSFAKRNFKAALAGLRNVSAKIKSNTKKLKADMRLIALLIALVSAMILVAPMNFQVREGNLTYQLAMGSTDGGYVEFSLGPAGSLEYHTHAVPVNLKMNLVLRNNLTNNQSLTNTFNSGVKRFKLDAVKAFYYFLASRILLIAVIGLAVGVIRSNGGKHWVRQTFKNALRWATCFLVITGVLVSISYFTLDRTPEAKYTGLVPTPDELQVQSESLAKSWVKYTNPPNVLVVHNIAQAQSVIDIAKSTKQYLTVVYGHDHKVGHKIDGLISLIDCGTGGASGFDEIGRNPNSSYSFQILEFSSGSLPVLTGVTTLGFDGLNGSSSVTYDPIN